VDKQPLASLSPHAPPIRVNSLLFHLLTLPIPSAWLRFRYVARDTLLVQLLQHYSAVISLVRHRLFHAPLVDAPGYFLRLFQRLAGRRAVASISRLQGCR
jgi:hypothetical protein